MCCAQGRNSAICSRRRARAAHAARQKPLADAAAYIAAAAAQAGVPESKLTDRKDKKCQRTFSTASKKMNISVAMADRAKKMNISVEQLEELIEQIG